MWFDTFDTPTTFALIPIGGEFIEALTTCDEVATRIEPTTHQGKQVNARRVGGKLVLMVEWEPVFIRGQPGRPVATTGPFDIGVDSSFTTTQRRVGPPPARGMPKYEEVMLRKKGKAVNTR